MVHQTTLIWCRDLPSTYLPTPLEVEPARLAYRRPRSTGNMPQDIEMSSTDAGRIGPSRRAWSPSDPGQNDTKASKRHSTPPDLPPRPSKAARRSWLLGYNMERDSRARPMSYPNSQNPGGLDTTDTKDLHNFEDIPLEDTRSKPQEPTQAPKRHSLRASLYRLSNVISLTPSDIPYPAPLFTRTHASTDDPYKAEQILGLRPSKPPPLPPKPPHLLPPHLAQSNPTNDSTPSLPSYNKPLPPRPLQPLNGRTAWLHALTAILVVGNCWGISNAFGLFQAYYTHTYLPGTSASTIAWIGSTQLALVFGLGVPVGKLVDMGHFRAMFHGGTLAMLVGLFASSGCKAFWSLWLTQGLLTGTGMGMVFCSGVLALMSWFDEKKMGVAMGLGAAGSCIGGIAYILLARHFLPAVGFANTMRILGGVATVSMIPPNLVFHMRDQTKPSQANQQPDSTPKTRLSLSPPYLSAALGFFLTFLGLYFSFVYIILFSTDILHLTPTASSNLLIYMLLANLPGRFLPALLSDKCLGPLNTLIPSALLSSAVIYLWAASSGTPNLPSLTMVACFYGFASAGVQVLYAPAVYTFCLEAGEGGEVVLERMGVRAGGIFSCIGVACLVGTPIGGELIGYRDDRGLEQPYLGAQLFAGTCLFVGGLFLLASRVMKVGWAAKRA